MLVYGAMAAAAVWSVGVPMTAVQILARRLPASALADRLGRNRPVLDTRPFLIHGVSAGEVQAAAPLVDALRRLAPARPVLLTTGTADGWRVATRLRETWGAQVHIGWLPWDRPSAMRRWIGAIRPAAVGVIETELWPGLFAACRADAIPLFVISGRLRPRDVERYRWLGAWWRRVMAMPAAILAQDDDQARAFRAIGAPTDRVDVGGNLKLDTGTVVEPTRGRRPHIIAGSTHAPEEIWILDAVAALRAEGLVCDLTLAPRHRHRAPAVRRAAAARGLGDARVIDTMGQLRDLYSTADLAVMGGTLAPIGGHNIVEPASAGCAVVIGPHVHLISPLVAGLREAGALVELPADGSPSAALADVLRALLRDPERRRALGRRARAWCAAQRGAAEHAARRLVDAAGPGQPAAGSPSQDNTR